MFRQATKFAPRNSLAFEQAAEAGFQAVEFWLGTKILDDCESVLELARSFSFDYALHFPNRGELTFTHLHNLVRLYHELACSSLVIHQPMFDEYGDALAKIDPSLQVGVENHFLDTDDKLHKWAKKSPKLTLDVEHLWLFTRKDSSLKQLLQTVDLLLTEYGEKIIHVHLPGYLPGQKEHRPQYCSRSMVMKVFSLLADHGYEGMVVSETASRFQNAEELMMDRLLLRRWEKKRAQNKGEEELAAANSQLSS